MKIRNKFSERKRIVAPGPDGTCKVQEHFADEVNINAIVARYRKTGVVGHVKRTQERYGDFTEIFNVGDSLDRAAKANQAFQQLPAELRNHFKNSIPGMFEYISKEENREQCEKWGILKKAPPPVATAADSFGGTSGPVDQLANKKTGKAKAPPRVNEPSADEE